MLDWFKRFPVRIAMAKLLNSYGGDKDNWKYSDVKFSLNTLGYKCRKDISWYFSGKSEVEIKDIQELCNWLIETEHEPEINAGIWKHPSEFEKSKKGNCVDSSLWAWRKLTELGLNSEFIVGERNLDGTPKQHAWVVYEGSDKNRMLIETVSKDIERMLYSVNNVDKLYIPWASVDNNFQNRLYGGYCSAIKRNNNWTF